MLCLTTRSRPHDQAIRTCPRLDPQGRHGRSLRELHSASSGTQLTHRPQWYMGSDALLTSGVTEKMLYLIRDPRARSPTDALNKVRKSRIVLFTLIELVGFGATFAITQTIAAIGFPVIIMLLVPVRVLIVPLLGFTDAELAVLDGPVASPFVSNH